jgi:hypothetical protein
MPSGPGNISGNNVNTVARHVIANLNPNCHGPRMRATQMKPAPP